jgi:flagellar biosynthesis protein FlhB
MRRRKSKFFTFIFSLLPGAGHMFMGFMKTGVSFMSAFFLIIFVASWLNIGPLLYILPVLWFFAFFDCINKYYSSDEEFAQYEDKYLFSLDSIIKNYGHIFKKQGLYAGILLIIFGVYLIFNNVMYNLWGYLPESIYRFISSITRIFPQLVIGIVIILVGIRLILVKKEEYERDV